MQGEILNDRHEKDEEEVVYRKALRLLSHREHSITELTKKLKMRDFSRGVIDRVVSRLVRLELLDDARFSEAFVREKVRNRPLGRKRLLLELVMKRGVPEDIANRAIASVMNEENIEEEELARTIVRKRRIGNRADIARILRNRGFDEGIIFTVMEEGNDRS